MRKNALELTKPTSETLLPLIQKEDVQGVADIIDDVDVVDVDLITEALSKNKKSEIAKMLLSKATVQPLDSRAYSWFYYIARYGMTDVIPILVKKGVDVNIFGVEASLEGITSKTFMSVIEALLDNGMDLNKHIVDVIKKSIYMGALPALMKLLAEKDVDVSGIIERSGDSALQNNKDIILNYYYDSI